MGLGTENGGLGDLDSGNITLGDLSSWLGTVKRSQNRQMANSHSLFASNNLIYSISYPLLELIEFLGLGRCP